MRYEHADDAGRLSVSYSDSKLDLYALGILNTNLQSIVDKVTFNMLRTHDLLASEEVVAKFEPILKPARFSEKKWPRHGPLVRAEVDRIKVGSLDQDTLFLLNTALTNADARAMLQGLAANVVWAIGASAARRFRNWRNGIHVSEESTQGAYPYHEGSAPYPGGPFAAHRPYWSSPWISKRKLKEEGFLDVGPNTAQIIDTLMNSPAEEDSLTQVEFVAKYPNGTKVSLKVSRDTGRWHRS